MIKSEYHNIPQNDWNSELSIKALNQCDKIIDDLSPFITKYLISFHDKKFSQKEIDIFLGDWINLYVHVIYDRLQSIKNINHVPHWISKYNKIFPPSFDSTEFGAKTALSDKFNMQLYSNIYYFLKNDDLYNCIKVKQFDLEKKHTIPMKICLYNKLIRYISKNNDILIHGEYIKNFFDRLIFAWRTRSFAIMSNYDISYQLKYTVSMDKRVNIYNHLIDKNEESIYFKLLPMYLPSAYLECFKSLSKNIKPEHKNFKYLFTGTFFQSASPLMRIILAKNKKAKVLNRFHGGGYRIFSHYWPEKLENRMSNISFTFGIPEKQSCVNYNYLPPPINRKKRRKNKRGYLFIYGPNPKYVTSINGYSIGIKNIEWCSKTNLLLKKIVSSELCVKLYSSEWAKNLNNEVSKIIINGKGNIYSKARISAESFNNYNIVLHNYLGTTFLESLGLNIPTICFYHKEVYSFSSAFEPYVKEFNDLGIFNSTIEKTADNFSKFKKNPREWWNNEKLQSVITNFQNDFFKISDDWKSDWENTLKNIIIK